MKRCRMVLPSMCNASETLPLLPQKFQIFTATAETKERKAVCVADVTATNDYPGNARATGATSRNLLSVAVLPSIILDILIINISIYRGLIGRRGNRATPSKPLPAGIAAEIKPRTTEYGGPQWAA